MQNIDSIKSRLKEYLSARGIFYDAKDKTYKCPKHNDSHPSAVYYAKGKQSNHPVLWCPICQESWNIFAVAAILDSIPADDFSAQLKSVCGTLGISEDVKPEHEAVILSIEEARAVYTSEAVQKIADLKKWGAIKKTWKFTTDDGRVKGLDVRFESDGGKKLVITFWYNGRTLKTVNPPVMLYNLHEIVNSDKPVLISEGCKCAEISRALEAFTPCTSSGGSGKSGLADWSPLQGREVFILRDNDEPGIKYAKAIQKQLPQAKIIKPVTAGKGDDVEQYLGALSIEDLTRWIFDPANVEVEAKLEEAVSTLRLDHTPVGDPDGFQILGLCEQEGHFIDTWGFYQHYHLESLSKGKLMNISDLAYWQQLYPIIKKSKTDVDWDEAINYIICKCKNKEFDTKRLKGRGAWRSNGKVCYNDGAKVYGEPDPNMIYLKDARKYIGLDAEPADESLLKRIRDIIFSLSFETKTDAVRTMGWAALAPFCGALEYRPTLLMTGESGHGKSKVQTLFLKKIADIENLDMRTTSEAGVRRLIGRDSRSVFFDEGGKENDKMKLNFETITAFIRSNFSEDSPGGVKAELNGPGTITYKLSSMFGIATTDPTIENVQDENRMIRVHFVKPKHTASEWQKIEHELIEIMSKENCDKIRSLTWKRLGDITKLTDKIVGIARDKSGRDYRTSFADSLLAAAYMVVWMDTAEPSDEQIESMLDKYYNLQPLTKARSEVEEYIDRILDEVVEVVSDGQREKVTIMEALVRIDRKEIVDDDGSAVALSGQRLAAHVRTLQQYGVKLHVKGVHFANDNYLLKKITGLGKGYEKILARHKGYVPHKDAISYAGGGSKRGVIISGLLERSKTNIELEQAVFGVKE